MRETNKQTTGTSGIFTTMEFKMPDIDTGPPPTEAELLRIEIRNVGKRIDNALGLIAFVIACAGICVALFGC